MLSMSCRVRFEARAEMRVDLAAQHERQRQADEQRQHPDAGEHRRRAVHAADAVATGRPDDASYEERPREQGSPAARPSTSATTSWPPSALRRERLRVVRVVHVEQQHALRIDLRRNGLRRAGVGVRASTGPGRPSAR